MISSEERWGFAFKPAKTWQFLKCPLQSLLVDHVRDTPAIVEFGRFRVAPHSRELIADGRPIKLGGRDFDVLMFWN